MADTVTTVLMLMLLFIGLPVSLLRIIDRKRSDAVYLRPGATEADTVYVAYHDGGDPEVFAESIGHMLVVLRQHHSQR